MIPYASRTGTRSTLSELHQRGWRLLVSATGVHRNEGFEYAIDNGAWSAHTQGEPWNRGAFERLLISHGDGADFVVTPDVVMDAKATLRKAEEWLPLLAGIGGCRLVAVQNGMSPDCVRAWLGPDVGIFIGGDTEWKEATARTWGQLARERNCWVHAGRVNTCRRIAIMRDAGVHSFDGTSAVRFPSTIPMLDREARQGHLFGGLS